MAFDLYITNQRIHWIWSIFQEVFCIYESPEDGHWSGPKHVVEVIHIKLQILLQTEVCKKCLINFLCLDMQAYCSNINIVKTV
jgi:hypothetical protein